MSAVFLKKQYSLEFGAVKITKLDLAETFHLNN